MCHVINIWFLTHQAFRWNAKMAILFFSTHEVFRWNTKTVLSYFFLPTRCPDGTFFWFNICGTPDCPMRSYVPSGHLVGRKKLHSHQSFISGLNIPMGHFFDLTYVTHQIIRCALNVPSGHPVGRKKLHSHQSFRSGLNVPSGHLVGRKKCIINIYVP
jgi:hypothetical protein